MKKVPAALRSPNATFSGMTFLKTPRLSTLERERAAAVRAIVVELHEAVAKAAALDPTYACPRCGRCSDTPVIGGGSYRAASMGCTRCGVWWERKLDGYP